MGLKDATCLCKLINHRDDRIPLRSYIASRWKKRNGAGRGGGSKGGGGRERKREILRPDTDL